MNIGRVYACITLSQKRMPQARFPITGRLVQTVNASKQKPTLHSSLSCPRPIIGRRVKLMTTSVDACSLSAPLHAPRNSLPVSISTCSQPPGVKSRHIVKGSFHASHFSARRRHPSMIRCEHRTCRRLVSSKSATAHVVSLSVC